MLIVYMGAVARILIENRDGKSPNSQFPVTTTYVA